MSLSPRRLRVLTIVAAIVVTCFYTLGPFSSSNSWLGSPALPLSTHKPPPSDGKLHWVPRNKDRYPVKSFIALPTGKPVQIPTIQAPSRSDEGVAAKEERLKRLAAVKESFVHSWEGYKKHAWLRDEVVPIAGGYRDTFGGWAATLVDALDTLWIMDMKEDFEMAVNAIEEIDFTTTEAGKINVFETTIRYLGGFLAAYDISGAKYPVLLTKAIEVGNLLMSCFDTPNRMPITRWDWEYYINGNKQKGSQMLVSELGSLSLEFTHLSQLTGDPKYYDAVQRISDVFEQSQYKTKLPGMWPVVVNAGTLSFTEDNNFHFGGMSDSLYEYLPKQYMMLGGLLDQSRKMYEGVMEVAMKYLFFRPLNAENQDILISGEIRANPNRVDVISKGQHLGCFVGGMVGIGSKIFSRPEDLEIAKKLTNGCVWAYASQVTGIAPEVFTLINCANINDNDKDCTWTQEKWHKAVQDIAVVEKTPGKTMEEQVRLAIQDHRLAPGFTHLQDKRYILRPEAIESVFMMYRITGDVEWQDKAWTMFQHIEAVTKTEIASSAIGDVTVDEPPMLDSMESFWLAETLKYFYLIFSDVDLVSLDEYVLNTEAHPLRRPQR